MTTVMKEIRGDDAGQVGVATVDMKGSRHSRLGCRARGAAKAFASAIVTTNEIVDAIASLQNLGIIAHP